MNNDSGKVVHRHITSVGAPVTAEDVDTYDRLSQIHAKEDEGRGQRQLRILYGVVLLALLSLQIVAVTAFAYLMGFGYIHIDRWVTATFIGGTLGEVSGMIFLVLRYLFPLSEAKANHD